MRSLGRSAGPTIMVRGREIDGNGMPVVMGILNVTPDSFSDGGSIESLDQAVQRACDMYAAGAQIIDIGGESTRPGADPVPAKVEQQRVVPVVGALDDAGFEGVISVDTRRASTARAALEAGAHLVNDVAAGQDPGMCEAVAEFKAGLVLMHMQGSPKHMQDAPAYDDVVAAVSRFLLARREHARSRGVRGDRIILDPGLGFGKRTGAGIEDNITLLARLAEVCALGSPVLVGASRKRFLGAVTGAALHERAAASVAAAAAAARAGAAIVRVHDVAETVQALRLERALARARPDRP